MRILVDMYVHIAYIYIYMYIYIYISNKFIFFSGEKMIWRIMATYGCLRTGETK